MCKIHTDRNNNNKQIITKILNRYGQKPLEIFELQFVDATRFLRIWFAKLQEIAGISSLSEFQILRDNPIFSLMAINQFKRLGNESLTNVKIAITQSKIIIKDKNEKLKIMNKYHFDPMTGGHAGRNRLYAKIKAKFYWKKMSSDIAKFVKSCHKCQLNKSKVRIKEKLTKTDTPLSSLDRLIIDTVGPLPISNNGNKYV